MDVAIDRTDAHTGMGDRPYEALGFAVVEQAVEDAKYIRLVIDLVTIRSMAAWNNATGQRSAAQGDDNGKS